MKYLLIPLTAMLVSCTTYEIKVVDEENNPIPQVEVFMRKLMFGSCKSHTGYTDTNGLFVVKMRKGYETFIGKDGYEQIESTNSNAFVLRKIEPEICQPEP
ncbi:hypothetical protein P4E94_19125 [Pontiellaceae bacterium B12219]|nr:hypothetical protein [Pontiellaceae bacterium B12219]